jgi:hypothetical protein
LLAGINLVGRKVGPRADDLGGLAHGATGLAERSGEPGCKGLQRTIPFYFIFKPSFCSSHPPRYTPIELAFDSQLFPSSAQLNKKSSRGREQARQAQ